MSPSPEEKTVRPPGNLPLLVASGMKKPKRTSRRSLSNILKGRPKLSREYTRADRTVEVCPPSTSLSSQGKPLFAHQERRVHLQLCEVMRRPSKSTPHDLIKRCVQCFISSLLKGLMPAPPSASGAGMVGCPLSKEIPNVSRTATHVLIHPSSKMPLAGAQE